MKLKAALEKRVGGKSGVRNAVLSVEAPGIDVTWSAGIADARTGTEMKSDTPFLSASVGKLFITATVLSLAAEGKLSLDDPLSRWLSPDVYDGLPVIGGNEALGRVTVRQLLAHRSGLPDYYEPTKNGPKSVLEEMVEDPDRVWATSDLLAAARRHPRAGAPGERFLYTDANYDLLGLITAAAAGRPFHEEVRARVIEPLGLVRTWYHKFEPVPEGVPEWADVFHGDLNLARTAALSMDEAGGGLATTAGDLRRFMRGLVDGRPVPFEAFQTEWTKNAFARGIDYAYGMWRIRPSGFFFLLGMLPDMYGVSGSTGSYAYYVPKHDVVVTGTFDTTTYREKHVEFLLRVVLPVLVRIEWPGTPQ